jgi:hypothetical protein
MRIHAIHADGRRAGRTFLPREVITMADRVEFPFNINEEATLAG